MDCKKEIQKLMQDSFNKKNAVSPIVLGNEIIFDCSSRSYLIRKSVFEQLNIFKPGDRVLDVCCNNGINSFILNKIFPYINLYGFDFDENAIKIANLIKEFEDIKNIEFNVCNMSNFSDYNKYDYILNSGIDNGFENFNSKVNLYKKYGFNGKILLIYNTFDNGVIFDASFIKERFNKTLEKYNVENIIDANIHNLLVINLGR